MTGLHPTLPKPHIVSVGQGYWLCTGLGYRALGCSPSCALRGWQAERVRHLSSIGDEVVW